MHGVSVRLCFRDSHCSCNCLLLLGKYKTWKLSPAPRRGNVGVRTSSYNRAAAPRACPCQAPHQAVCSGTLFIFHDPPDRGGGGGLETSFL